MRRTHEIIWKLYGDYNNRAFQRKSRVNHFKLGTDRTDQEDQEFS